ncbi:hypothetical protein UM89_21870 [Bacillus subtilis]|nr:hypothetical protein UM89_21870 [Bacillus subtilis]
MEFNPNPREQLLIQKVLKVHSEEYALVRLTRTMLHKSIIDASALIRDILKEGGIVDYAHVGRGPDGKIMKEVILLSSDAKTEQGSFLSHPTNKR